MKTQKTLHIVTRVDGIEGDLVARVATGAIPQIMHDLAKAKLAANDLGIKWESAASSFVAYAGAHGCQMAAAGPGRNASKADLSQFALHACSVVWLLHHKGLLREAKARAHKDMVVVRVSGDGIKGIHMNFEPISHELLAANDNISSKQRLH